MRLRVEVDETPGSSETNPVAESSAAEAAAQRRAMLELDAEIIDVQDLSPDDGLSSGDHDRILYGEAT